MTITAPDLDIAQGTPDDGPSLIPSDPWSVDWAPPTRAAIKGRHESARRHQQDRRFPCRGGSRYQAGDESAVPAEATSVERREGRRRRSRVIRIAMVTAAIGLAVAAAATAYWYFALLNG